METASRRVESKTEEGRGVSASERVRNAPPLLAPVLASGRTPWVPRLVSLGNARFGFSSGSRSWSKQPPQVCVRRKPSNQLPTRPQAGARAPECGARLMVFVF